MANDERPTIERQTWPMGQGEMADRLRAFDWAATLLGPIGSWPQSLKTAVELMLSNSFASALIWGREGILLYNDASRLLLGSRHPAALGNSVLTLFPEAQSRITPVLERVFDGETVRIDDQHMSFHQDHAAREARFTACLSPLHDERGEIVAVSAIAFEISDRIATEHQSNQPASH